MREMATKELNGVADMMRWEILYNEGGFLGGCRQQLHTPHR